MAFGKLDEKSSFGQRLTDMMEDDNKEDLIHIDTPKRDGGTLKGWYPKKFIFVSGKDPLTIVFGHIHGDERWIEGHRIRTSPIINLNIEDRILETENTIYRLGDEATEDDIASIRSLSYGIPIDPENTLVDDVTEPEHISEEEQAKRDAILQAMIF